MLNVENVVNVVNVLNAVNAANAADAADAVNAKCRMLNRLFLDKGVRRSKKSLMTRS